MARHQSNVAIRLREMILDGTFAPGDHVREATLATMLGVSRTPVRLALGTLEHEGLLTRTPHRGFTVRSFTLQDICQAIDVRGVLEGMAARLVAERGMSATVRADLAACLNAGDALLDKGYIAKGEANSYEAMNVRFHDTVIGAADNGALADALAYNNKVPFSGAGAVAFHDTGDMYRQFALGHSQHHLIFEALDAGEGARAEALMREHALVAKKSLNLLHRIDGAEGSASIPGLRLVRQ